MKRAKSDVLAVAEHVWVHQHQMDFQSVSIFAHECDLQQHLSLESCFTRKFSTINREMGLLVPALQLSVLTLILYIFVVILLPIYSLTSCFLVSLVFLCITTLFLFKEPLLPWFLYFPLMRTAVSS